MKNSKAFLFGGSARILIWALLGAIAGCLTMLALVAANLLSLHSGSGPLLPNFEPSASVVYGLAGAGLVALAICAIGIGAAGGRAMTEHAEVLRQRRDQEAILRLLGEMSALAKGDLTVTATVTEDVTGSIADSLNRAIAALRELVLSINDAAEQVAVASNASFASARELVSAGDAQSRHVQSASECTRHLVDGAFAVSEDVRRAVDVGGQLLAAARSASSAVRDTAQGIESIQGKLHKTQRHVKQLGESSQEMDEAVELVNDISDQASTLALNASIQASMAGESGRGFAVVADEVQRLAERAATSARHVDSLVRRIQGDTGEALVAMESSTNGVSDGSQLVETANRAAVEMAEISGRMEVLVNAISAQTEQQGDDARQLSRLMGQIDGIASQTEEGVRATSEKHAELAESNRRLGRSIGGFTVPESQG